MPGPHPDISLIIHSIIGIPIVNSGDDLAELIVGALSAGDFTLQDGDVCVVAQKIVSLAEGRKVRLDDVQVSTAAEKLAAQTDVPALG